MTAGRSPGPPIKKPAPGQPWSHQETIHLIEAYEAKWYSLKRGQLKAQQWEEVTAEVAARCGFDSPSKTATQCRHKVEKLRKRYRSERTRPGPSPWPYFDRMDWMDRGPLPISVCLPSPPLTAGGAGSDSDDDELEDERVGTNNTRNISGILKEGNWGFSSRVSRNPGLRKRRDFNDEEGEGLKELAKVVRRFEEGFVGMEKRRMEMMRDLERDWMEMDAKRAEMVIESERCLVESIAGAFASLKKAKRSQDL